MGIPQGKEQWSEGKRKAVGIENHPGAQAEVKEAAGEMQIETKTQKVA